MAWLSRSVSRKTWEQKRDDRARNTAFMASFWPDERGAAAGGETVSPTPLHEARSAAVRDRRRSSSPPRIAIPSTAGAPHATITIRRSRVVLRANRSSAGPGGERKMRCEGKGRGRPPGGAQRRRRARPPACCSYSARTSWTPASRSIARVSACMSAGGLRRMTSSPSSQTSSRSSPAPCSSTTPDSGTYQKPSQRALKNRRGRVGSSSRKSREMSGLTSAASGMPVKLVLAKTCRRRPVRSDKRPSSTRRSPVRAAAIAT